jgi:hypothetical protein
MGSRIVLQGTVFVCSPCPYGCKEHLTIKLCDGEEAKNGECPNCHRKVHAHHYDNVVRQGHFTILKETPLTV